MQEPKPIPPEADPWVEEIAKLGDAPVPDRASVVGVVVPKDGTPEANPNDLLSTGPTTAAPEAGLMLTTDLC